MRGFWNFLMDSRTLSVLGVVSLCGVLLVGASTLQVAMVWAMLAIVVTFIVCLAVWAWRKYQARKNGGQLSSILEQQAEKAATIASADSRAEVEVLKKRLLAAIGTIKTSKLGETSGAAALYELPWYLVIGNPAAGKSSAIVNSGLQFPFADSNGSVIHGIGGTRNCDWFFTTEGILLDTAGRYSVHEEDRNEWFGFLDLLKKYRPKAPVNGIVVAASIAELAGNRPDHVINLAKNLRQRVQELTERLEVLAPVYVVFTKADLIAGFTEFFQDCTGDECNRVWGASLPFQPDSREDPVATFDQHFEYLYDGLKEMSVVQMSLERGQRMAPGVISFPMEFVSVKPALKSFIATLFEENPYQFKPVFRGFYFTSALQDGSSVSSSAERVAHRFGLNLGEKLRSDVYSRHGFFLKDLFSKVIFEDRNLVRQFASRRKLRLRLAGFVGMSALLGLSMGAWTWSYLGNQQLVSSVGADLQKAVHVQENRIDLQSRLEALDVLQDRIEQLSRSNSRLSLSVGLGLYQGDSLERKLRQEFYSGVRNVMLKPVTGSLESFLTEVNASSDKLQPMTKPPESAATSIDASPSGQYKDASAASVEDAYNGLKTYLMLADKQRVEAGHLTDQLTRFWRGWLEINRGNMPREQMIRSAERIISFYLSNANDADWPVIETKLALVEQSRETLRRVVRGMPARERVYAEIKARAATRFSPVTVPRIVGDENKLLVSGSYAVSGAFTRSAWENYVQGAIKEASNTELQSTDWVLKTAARSDLTLEGSPEQIQKALIEQYKAEYVREWQRFMQGIAIPEFGGFDSAVNAMNRLGDPQVSPISKIVTALYDNTSWDNPSLVNSALRNTQRGFVEWFRQTILRQAPAQVAINVNVDGTNGQIPMGSVGREFGGVARLMVARDNNQSLLKGYLEALSKIRTRFNQMKNQGDPGPGARQFMQQTLEGSGSEVADALKYVDEQMLTGMSDAQRASLRPLLVRPLLQSFAVVVTPAEQELNKVWTAQVFEPFSRGLATKYPFNAESHVEASAAEIAQIFGPEGAIAKFTTSALGPLVVRRGDILTSRTWGDIGLTLSPEYSSGIGRWIAPLDGGGAGGSGATASAQTVFQIQPLPAAGLSEYSIEVDGQLLRYRNTAPQWTNFVWPNPSGQPGAKITAIAFDGRTIDVISEPGRFGLEKLINSAKRTRKDGGIFELSWSREGLTVAADMRIVSSARTGGDGAAANGNSPQGGGLRGTKLPTTIVGASRPAMPESSAAAVASGSEGHQ